MENVIKTYRVQQRGKSIIGVVKSFFTKNYKEINAVNNLSLTINKGELVGYIGVNGAGKSTTIKMLVGILAPTKGKISVLGKDPHKHRREIAKRIGVVFGQRSQLIWDLPPIDTFDLFSKIYEI
ncbi:ATP-binding cassette domain-containing protein [Caldicellulosiruptor acetigenus]|uniref:ATP-binding cassette domain-containing protein n=1 Tax=Caldicellulosiruptor acetigenus TaxID=301953 RepID=UPI0001E99799|nr:ATP-binding cassette domain-containing protein [Caldicellulosiruptor acetigenus]